MTGFSNIGRAEGLAGIGANGAPEGDLTGSYPNPLVVGMWDHPIDPRNPSEGDSLIFHGGEWVPTPSPTAITLFKGPWNANTNTPDIKNFPGLADGYTWIVTVAGNYSGLDSITSWDVGDYALYSGGNWYKLSNKTFGWGLTGNAGTVSSIDFVGTTDQSDLVLKANDSEVMRLYYGGGSRLSGSVLASSDLQVVGNITGSNEKLTGNLVVCGGNISTNSSIFNLLLGATGRINMGNSGATNWFSGSVLFPQGISGSLTHLTDGTSYIIAGNGLTVVSGTNGSITVSMPTLGTPGTYGSASSIPIFVVDEQGRITSVTPTSIQISESQVTNLLTDLTSSYNSVTNLSSSLASQKADKITTISAGTGLTGGGDLSANRTISLGNTGSAGTYGSASSVPVLTTDAQGRVTLVAPTSIQIAESQVTNLLTDLTASANSLASVSSSLASEKANKTTSINAGLGLTGGGNLSADRTLAINNSVVATISGSTFTGAVTFNAGLSGSHTKLTDGTSAFIAGNNINITSSSNGPVTFAFSAGGTPANGDFLTFSGSTWVTTSPVQASAASYQQVYASEAIAAGDVCYILNSGGSSAIPTVARAQANSLSTIHGVVGFATASIPKNTYGACQTYGQLAGPVDTHTFGQGDPIFVSPTTPGGVTNVKPSGPNYAFQMGIVTRQGQPQNATTGIVFISPMSQNDTQNISDLVFTAPTDHDGMMYDPATSTWKNQQPLWIPETQTAVTLNSGSTITAANFAGVVYLPIKTQGGANIVLNATTPIASLTKTAQDYGRELWLHNVDNNRTITIPKGANVLLTGSVNLTISASTIVKFLWTGIGGNGSWIQTGPATTIG